MIDFKNYIETIPNFPKEGILYRDIQPLLEHRNIFRMAIDNLGKMIERKPDYWVGIDSRGFIFASALAMLCGGGVKLIRKAGKLPNKNLETIEYDLEYGTDKIQMKGGEGGVVIVDDVFATGGTMKAAELLCDKSGYTIIDKVCLLDIGIVKGHDVKCLITYE